MLIRDGPVPVQKAGSPASKNKTNATVLGGIAKKMDMIEIVSDSEEERINGSTTDVDPEEWVRQGPHRVGRESICSVVELSDDEDEKPAPRSQLPPAKTKPLTTKISFVPETPDLSSDEGSFNNELSGPLIDLPAKNLAPPSPPIQINESKPRVPKDIVTPPETPKRPEKAATDSITSPVISSTPETDETKETGTSTPKKTPRTKKLKPEEARVQEYARTLMTELCDSVFGQIPAETPLKWNARLLKTAGRAKFCRHRDDTYDMSIELSTKVVDREERVRNTLSHELCHLAVFLIDGDLNPSHGVSWKKWANKVMRFRPDIVINATHTYEINYRFYWECVVCQHKYGRHTKSIKTDLQRCQCKGQLRPLFDDNATPKKAQGKNAAALPTSSPITRLESTGHSVPDSPSAKRSKQKKPSGGLSDSDILDLAESLGYNLTLTEVEE
ncbi:hypothetical protein SISNIDRAFT_551632 [Sistotremastrum niveocremeum HHB9708]|uniref:SprT-like domain-containing protein n=1 Tax=Sistotremastrum niveocremeum HHB9708 TaxID=1314777 RepID=A0A164R7J2_9AGAM|nr:hypothetical protein SISNIDRAFT_551632 [Sistotremastrum niveocremeum HHB9708]